MLQLHIDFNDHYIVLNVPNSKYAKTFILRQNWNFEFAFLYDSKRQLMCKYFFNEFGILCQKNYRRFKDV